MKNIFKIIIMLGAVLFAACDDKLDLTPKNSIGDSKAFESVNDLKAGKIGVYGDISSFSNITLSSRASDDLRLNTKNTGQGQSIHNWTYTASDADISGLWNGGYKSIDIANRVLEAANKFGEGKDAAEKAIINDVKGHCLFVRAHAHFEIYRAYCPVYSDAALGIPYMEKYTVTGSPARLTALEVINKIKADITEAAKLLPSKDVDRKFANVDAANALMARVLLYSGDYTNAITYAQKVIDESGLRIANRDEVENYWKDAAADEVETIFRLNKSTDDGKLGGIFLRNTNDDIFFQPSVNLVSKYGANDIRKTVYFGELSGETIVNKYLGRDGEAKNLVHVKLYRISEMYLIKAEANANLGELTETANAVFEIQKKRDTDATVAPVYANKQAAMDGALLEKRKEMAFEGHRFYDLKRYNKGIVRTGLDSLLATDFKLPAGDYKYVFPIPQHEMFANKNMVQNKDY